MRPAAATFATIALSLAALPLACGGGSSANTPEPTRLPPTPALGSVPAPTPSVGTPAPTPTATVHPTPAQTPAESLLPARTDFDPATLSVPVCTTVLRDGALPGYGTVPQPTPTPTPTPAVAPTPRSLDAARTDAAAYLAEATRIAAAGAAYMRITNQIWQETNDFTARAESVFVESRRVAALCNALALTGVPPEAGSAHGSLADLLEDRQNWAAAAALLVREQSRTSSADLDTTMAALGQAIDNADRALAALAAEFDVMLPAARNMRITNDRARVEFDPPPGWFLVRNDAQVILTAPPELQAAGIPGLGPGREGYGTSVRIRRLRNAPGWTLADAEQQIAPLLTQLGEPQATRAVSVDGNLASSHTLLDAQTNWETVFLITVAGDYTYFFETGCPAEFSTPCAAALTLTTTTTNLLP